MRCMTLAQALKARGADCHFLCKDIPGHSMEKIRSHGFPVFPLAAGKENPEPGDPAHAPWLEGSWKEDATQSLYFLKTIQPNWILVDHYGLDIRWEKKIRPCTGKIFVLDDLADRCHDCDILLDSGRDPESLEYKNLVPPHCILLLGTDHVLLRNEFIRMRPESLKRRANPALRRILITMGGMDTANVTGRILKTLRSFPFIKNLEVEVVLGGKAPHLEAVRQEILSFPCPVQMHIDTPSMAKLMAKSDLAIGAPGSTSWERCCMGLPSILFLLAENQKAVVNIMNRHGAAWVLPASEQGFGELEKLLGKLLQHPGLLHEQSRRAAQLIRGSGTDHVCQHLIPSRNLF